MDFYEVVKHRRSMRGFLNKAIPEAALERIGDAVALAPSACNRQPLRFEVVLNGEIRRQICEIYPQPWLAQAPASARRGAPPALRRRAACWPFPATDIDVAIAMEHLVLAATAEGLGCCWVCAFDVDKMSAALAVKSPWRVVAISPLGYADVPPRDLKRKEKSEIFEVVK
ncbi:MAG: nitroreductase family protein [Victivallaceae bacterium]